MVDHPTQLLAALLAREAAEPESPFLFWPDGWDWRWWSWGRVAQLTARWQATLADLPAGARVGFAGDAWPGALVLDLAAQAAGLEAVPTAAISAGEPSPEEHAGDADFVSPAAASAGAPTISAWLEVVVDGPVRTRWDGDLQIRVLPHTGGADEHRSERVSRIDGPEAAAAGMHESAAAPALAWAADSTLAAGTTIRESEPSADETKQAGIAAEARRSEPSRPAIRPVLAEGPIQESALPERAAAAATAGDGRPAAAGEAMAAGAGAVWAAGDRGWRRWSPDALAATVARIEGAAWPGPGDAAPAPSELPAAPGRHGDSLSSDVRRTGGAGRTTGIPDAARGTRVPGVRVPGVGVRRQIVVAGMPLGDVGGRLIAAWATIAGAALVLDGDPGRRRGAMVWARPTALFADAGELAWLRREAAGGAGVRRRRRWFAPGAGEPRRPFDRLRTVFQAGPPDPDDVAFWGKRGARLLQLPGLDGGSPVAPAQAW
jgi:hypothetical protein